MHRRITRPPTERPYLLGELVFILFLLRLYDLVRTHAEVRAGSAIDAGRNLLKFETWVHIDFEHSLNHWTVEHRWFNYATSYWYQFSHIAVTMAVLAWCWWWRPAAYRVYRNALLLINVVGLTIFLLLPMAPPRLLPNAGIRDADALVGFATNNVGPVTEDVYGAFPSLHIAWAVWVAVVVFTQVRYRPLARAAIVYPFITLTAIVATGNHYVMDAVAGAILAFAALATARAATRSARTPVPAPATAAPRDQGQTVDR